MAAHAFALIDGTISLHARSADTVAAQLFATLGHLHVVIRRGVRK
jgi:hypothetical protein